ncbi:hypothetical protein ABZ545_28900, partial [Streptomyces abikoensis]|uniref:hypothetical protein n=1 Tax=Streptomyces TaxID=1883 RepID=UPI00340B1134
RRATQQLLAAEKRPGKGVTYYATPKKTRFRPEAECQDFPHRTDVVPLPRFVCEPALMGGLTSGTRFTHPM